MDSLSSSTGTESWSQGWALGGAVAGAGATCQEAGRQRGLRPSPRAHPASPGLPWQPRAGLWARSRFGSRSPLPPLLSLPRAPST